ncbi:unnamed protein product [Chironomus riparius]|uniref:BTB domain-containing protein n=1 Tax=Chironomus riparius TaxID=315576 RepID=A0A9N9WVC2_9DIPT|nr:unnamed protein product [Chironomus riparius]
MVVYCQFKTLLFDHGETYYCGLINKTQPPGNRRLDIARTHECNKTNNDVNHIKFDNCIVTSIPQELTLIFPNLKNLVIYNSKLKKISKNDLIDYRNLEIISFVENEIEFLPGDLFQHFKHLSIINFKGNKLTLIEPNILNGLEELKMVNFSENPRYENFFSIYPVHNPNATLEEVKNELYEKFYSRYDFLQDLKNSEEHLKLKNNQLKKKMENMLTNHLTYDVTADFKNFIRDENSKDFKIIIDDQEFLVHKFLLIIRSPTLGDILRNNPDVESLNLVDIPIPIFEKILKWFYTDELAFENKSSALPIFAAAGRLKLKKLIDCAAEKLLDQVNPENALEILNLSAKFQKYELKKKAFEEVKKKYPNFKFRDELLENPDKLKFIIDMFKDKEEANRKFEENLKKMAIMD